MEKGRVFITGYAKLPEGITAKELYNVIAIGVVVDRFSSKILEAEATLSTSIAKKFVSELLVGEELNCIESIEDKIRIFYHGSAKKAILSAIRICYQRYIEIVKM